MAFKGKEYIHMKIVIENEVIEQILHFIYLACDLTYEKENNVQKKLHKLQHIYGTFTQHQNKMYVNQFGIPIFIFI